MLVHLIAQSHLDPVFMWPWVDGQAEALNTISEAIRKLRNHKDLRFTCSSSLVHEWFRKFRPDKWKDLQELVREGRWVPVGGWYVQGDTSLPGGESLIRQALVGQKQFSELTGYQSDVAYLVDSFGHPATLGKILTHCGYKYFTFGRPGSKMLELKSSVFYWVSDDGSKLLCSRIPVRYSTYDDEVLRVQQAVEINQGKYEHVMCFFGLGDHGGGPTEAQIQRMKNFARLPESPEMKFSDPVEFFRSIEKSPDIPEFSGPLEPFAVGCYSAAVTLKRAHDIAQRELLQAETALVLAREAAGCDASSGTEMLDRAWKNLLFAEFHDILPGSGIKEGLDHAMRLLGSAHAEAEQCKIEALTHISRKIDTSKEGYIHLVAFNNTPGKRAVYLEYEPWLFWQSWDKYRFVDSAGNDVPQQRIPSAAAARALTRVLAKVTIEGNGFEYLRVIGPEPDLSDLAITENCYGKEVARRVSKLTAKPYTLDFNPEDGTVNRIMDRQRKCGISVKGLCDALVIRDRSDTWTIHHHEYARNGKRFSRPDVRLLEEGPLRWAVESSRQFGRSELVQEYRVYDESPIIEVRNRLNWQHPWHLCKIRIPNPFGRRGRIMRGVAFGQSSAPDNGREFSYQDWLMMVPDSESANGKLAGLAVLAGPGLHSADFTQDDGIRLTVVRSPVYCHEELGARYHPSHRHEHMEIGEHEFVFGILPIFEKISPAELTEYANWLYPNNTLITSDSHKGTLLSENMGLTLGPANVAITACKPADSGDGVIIRLWETAGRDTRGMIRFTGQEIPFEISANAIKTIKIHKNSEQYKALDVNGIEKESV